MTALTRASKRASTNSRSGEPVQVADRLRTHGVVPGQGDGVAFGPAHHGAGDMAARRGLAAARQDEILSGGSASL